MKRDNRKNKNGFTLVELLTTLAIVGILLGLLIPALNQVRIGAAKVKQKAQFHAISIGLEAFQSDMGYYPPSQGKGDVINKYYTASQMLAEAIVGRDGLGFHVGSTFQRDNTLYVNASTTPPPAYIAGDRKGPYLELESANAVKPSDIYASYGSVVDSYLLVDMYKHTKHLKTGKLIGMPILYYRADTSSASWPVTPGALGYASGDYNLAKVAPYNVYDALSGATSANKYGIVNLGAPYGGVHPMASTPGWFYTKIQNPNFDNPPRPYRSESFILQSAGEDGLYGTEDDIFNFDQDN